MKKKIVLGTTIEEELECIDAVQNKLKAILARDGKIAEEVLNTLVEYELALEKELEHTAIDYELELEETLSDVNSVYPTDADTILRNLV